MYHLCIKHIRFPPLTKCFPHNQTKFIGNKITMKSNKHIHAGHVTLKTRKVLLVVTPLICQLNL